MSISADNGPLALDAPPRRGTRDRLRLWRQSALANPSFRAALDRFPFTRWYANRRAADLLSIMSGFVQSQVLFAALETGLLTRLQKSPATPDALSAALRIPIDRMRAFLQSTECLQLTSRLDTGECALDDFGSVVVSDPGIQTMIRHHALFYRDLSDPLKLLRNGPDGGELNTFWTYVNGSGTAVTAESARTYSAVMSSSQVMLSQDILTAFDFKACTAVLDIGGGEGIFLDSLAREHPDLRIGLLDLPAVAERAEERLAARGLMDRGRCHGGNFFTDPIPSGYDGVTLIRVLFDHDDDTVMRLLINIKNSVKSGTTIVVAEPMAGRGSAERIAAAYFSIYLMAMGGGFCRSFNEIRILLEKAGFRSVKKRRCRRPMLATVAVAQA